MRTFLVALIVLVANAVSASMGVYDINICTDISFMFKSDIEYYLGADQNEFKEPEFF